MMKLPQRLTIDFIPVDAGLLCEIEITPQHKCSQEEVLELLEFAAERLEALLYDPQTEADS